MNLDMEKYNDLLITLSKTIWDYAELKFNEYKSANAIIEVLKSHGFTIRKNLAGMETAFSATIGSGHPVIGLLAEYDALSGLSQQAFVEKMVPREGTTIGHGCGHHMLGTASVGAALLAHDYLEEKKLPGTIVLIGCPAEEGGSGKAYLARAGEFDNLDVALTWHPAAGYAVTTGSYQANCQVYFRFKGISAHAAGAPHLGRSALDAVELMDVGTNYMHEHIEPTDRIHYAITDTGGVSPNVVQNHAEVIYLIRSINNEKVKKLYDRVCKIAKGAAMMTETEVQIVFDKACSNLMSNSVLEKVLYKSMKEIPLPTYTDEELAFAKKMKPILEDSAIPSDSSLHTVTIAQKKEYVDRLKKELMADFIVEYEHSDMPVPGSTDVGDCSHAVPTAQFNAACYVPGTPGHSWQLVAQGKTPYAMKGMLYAAKVLATAACHIIDDPSIAKAAKEEYVKATDGKPFVSPIPPEILPNMNAKKAK
jgi:aminobenzoyl-glutamate utilization protein B